MTLEELKIVIRAETEGLLNLLNQVQNLIGSFSKNVSKSTSSIGAAFGKLGKLISVAAIVTGLVKVGKQAITTASDLQEVLNVVDVSFGSAASEINDFAKTAITKLGMSELAAKLFSSTFMAMGNGMGVLTLQGKEMAIGLTELTGDMASFYNVDLDVVATALKSVYTGETETLKKFGIVMTEANLQAYALSQGITKNVKDMSQAEKVALRYGFVMQTTANAQGDFARTSDSWANLTRILKELWNLLIGVLGKGLLNVITPLVKAMNLLLASAISVANAMASAFGWNGIESSATSVESISTGMEDAVSATEDETEASKKLQTTLGSFDELNILNGQDDSNTGASGASGIADMSSVTAEAEQQSKEITNSKLEAFKSFVEECKSIFDKWFKDLPELEFNFDSSKALLDLKNIGLDLANIVAGWGSFVVTIGINLANDLDIGRLANDFLSLFEALTDLGSTLTDILVPALESLYDKALKPIVQWIGDKLHDAYQRDTAIIKDFTNFLKEHTSGIQAWIDIIAEVIKAIWKVVEPIASAVWEIFWGRLESIYEVAKFLLGIFFDLGEVIKLAFTDPQAALDLLHEKMAKWKKDFVELGDKLLDKWLNIFNKIKENGINQLSSLWDSMKTGFSNLWTFIKGLFTPLKQYFVDLWNTIKSNTVNTVLSIKESIENKFKEIWNNVKTGAQTLILNLKSTFGTLPTLFTTWLSGVKTKFTDCWNSLQTGAETAWNKLKSGASTAVSAVKQIFSVIPDWFKTTFTNAWTNVKNVFSTGGKIFDGIKEGILEGLKAIVNGLIKGINKVVATPFNGLNKAITRIKNTSILGLKPFSGLSTVSVPQIPLLAKGAVIDSPTLAMIGEQTGNTEIVTPEKLLEEIIAKKNSDMVSALSLIARLIITAIDGVEMQVAIGDDVIARSAARGNQSYYRRTGRALIQ